MNTFNPIESAVISAAQTPADTHAAPEYRSAFFKRLLGKELTEGETRAFATAAVEKRADSFNTLSNSAAVIPTQTLNEVVKPARNTNGLYNEVRLFNVPEPPRTRQVGTLRAHPLNVRMQQLPPSRFPAMSLSKCFL